VGCSGAAAATDTDTVPWTRRAQLPPERGPRVALTRASAISTPRERILHHHRIHSTPLLPKGKSGLSSGESDVGSAPNVTKGSRYCNVFFHNSDDGSHRGISRQEGRNDRSPSKQKKERILLLLLRGSRASLSVRETGERANGGRRERHNRFLRNHEKTKRTSDPLVLAANIWSRDEGLSNAKERGCFSNKDSSTKRTPLRAGG
jgi:hypothetical protein